jgi:hypothetical protein
MKGRICFQRHPKTYKDAEGCSLPDITEVLGYAAGIATQWQKSKLIGVWPNKWKATPEAPDITYSGMVAIKVPPWMLKKSQVAPAPKKK